MERVRGHVLDALTESKGWKAGLVRGKPEFFRGDAWQTLISDPREALRVALFVRASLLARDRTDTRISIGIGPVEQISKKRISLSTGEAFVLSGRALDEMTSYSRLTVALPDKVGPLKSWMPVLGELCDALIRGWTSRQAEMVRVALRLLGSSHEEIAGSLQRPVSKQAVTTVRACTAFVRCFASSR